MVSSKEALDKLCDLATPNGECLNYDIGLGMAIKQALERLEQLEKENQELKEQRLSLSLQLQDYKLIKEITLPNVLEENEKLKEEINELSKDELCFEKRCDKLEKFIDFLKLNFDISLDSKLRISDGSECVQTFIIDLPKNSSIDEMFKIIKEVLE